MYLQAAGLVCETTDGTMLGTVKFEGSLPWEVDGDVEILKKDLPAFEEKIYPLLRKLNYKIVSLVII